MGARANSRRDINVTRFTQRMGGKPVALYVAALPAELLINKLKVDVYDAGQSPDGYQRRPYEYRFKDIARYVERQEGLLPTAILINIRDQATFEPDGDERGEGPVTGRLRIPDDAPFWVVDGQHRVYGLREAAERLKSANADAVLDYDVPVVFTAGFSKIEEMRLFDIVNSKAKSVPTDLAATLLLRAIRKEGRDFFRSEKGGDKALRKAVGAQVALHLNSAPGPWQGKIRLPNEIAVRKAKPLQVNAIASSLEPALRDPYVKTFYTSDAEMDREWPTICGLIHTFWDALAKMMPEAFADIANYSVQRTAGAYAWHQVFPDVIYRVRERGDFSVKGFKAVFESMDNPKWVDSKTWDVKEGDPVTLDTGMGGIRRLAEEIRHALPPMETPGLDEPKGMGPKKVTAVLARAGVVHGE